jgi:hypothetical protein
VIFKNGIRGRKVASGENSCKPQAPSFKTVFLPFFNNPYNLFVA